MQPTPIAPANPVPISAPVIPPAINPLPEAQPLPTLDPSLASSLQPLPQATTTPPPAMSDAPPPAIAEIKPSADGRYHIVIDNQNSNALNAARKVVPDAYLSPSSTLIYLATVKTKEEAQQRLKQLQAKGIQARIQQP